MMLNLVTDKQSTSDIFLAEEQANLTGTLIASLSNCPTSVCEPVCTNLAHSLLSCSSLTVCAMELTAGHHLFSMLSTHVLSCPSFCFFFNVLFSPSIAQFSFAVSACFSCRWRPAKLSADCFQFYDLISFALFRYKVQLCYPGFRPIPF